MTEQNLYFKGLHADFKIYNIQVGLMLAGADMKVIHTFKLPMNS